MQQWNCTSTYLLLSFCADKYFFVIWLKIKVTQKALTCPHKLGSSNNPPPLLRNMIIEDSLKFYFYPQLVKIKMIRRNKIYLSSNIYLIQSWQSDGKLSKTTVAEVGTKSLEPHSSSPSFSFLTKAGKSEYGISLTIHKFPVRLYDVNMHKRKNSNER